MPRKRITTETRQSGTSRGCVVLQTTPDAWAWTCQETGETIIEGPRLMVLDDDYDNQAADRQRRVDAAIATHTKGHR